MARTVKIDGSAIQDVTASETGKVVGTYFHGIFENKQLRRTLLENIAREKGVILPPEQTETADIKYDRLAEVLRQNLDMKMLYEILGLDKTPPWRTVKNWDLSGH